MYETYAGDPFLVTVAGYDATFASDSAYDNYGAVYNDRSQVGKYYCDIPAGSVGQTKRAAEYSLMLRLCQGQSDGHRRREVCSGGTVEVSMV